ncbi:MAG: glutamate synthase small subunit, partial [Phycisphaerae bacterium]|nr:glutamate synthase small subunit [Phycisphaerae bacterium]
PIDPDLVGQLAAQCRRMVVVEERRGFMEEQISEIVTRARQSGQASGDVELWGKEFPGDLAGLPATRGLHPSILIERLVPLVKLVDGSSTAASLDREIETLDTVSKADVGKFPVRLPTFCPGCPHRDSSILCLEIKNSFMDGRYMQRVHNSGPVDLLFHGDIGCYTMLMFPPNNNLMHDLSGMGLGGATGSGTDPFLDNKEVVFMGDSTFFHSGALAISQAVKLGQDITFIILDNSTTAMTGHQTTPELDFDVLGSPTATQDIEDIVRGIVSTTDVPIICVDPEKRLEYRRLLEQTFLADGVKVIIADKECAITRIRRKRRAEQVVRRRLGYLPRWEHMNINQEICRFCLACAELAGCPGLKHTQTDYGRKMNTDITWCVNDGACQRIGVCSSFERVTIKRKRPPRSRVPELGLDDIPEPVKRPAEDLWRCCLAGVGGMGIGTVTSIMVRAGHNEGYDVLFIDKKGLAIRNGSIVSQVVYNISKKPVTAIIPYGKADLLLGVDILEATRTLDPAGRMRVASPSKTAAVINTDKVLTIRGIMGQEDFDPGELEKVIHSHTRSADYMARNISAICEKYLGSKVYANIMMLGFAFQKGVIPVSMHSMAWAIKDTIRTAFRKNLYAFNMGRKLVMRQDLFQGPPTRTGWRDTLEDKFRWTVRRYRSGQQLGESLRELGCQLITKVDQLDEPLKRGIIIRLYDCMRWGGLEYARRFADGVAGVYKKDDPDVGYQATRAVATNLATAMLIKDLFFVAELATSPEKYVRDREKYDVNPANGDRIIYHHLLHFDLSLGRRSLHLHFDARPWQLKALKRMRLLRRVLPGWHKADRRFLARYERLIAQFTYANRQEYDRAVAMLQSPHCINCMNPLCQQVGCPLESRIPEWIDLHNRGQWRMALEHLHQSNNFPEFTGHLCPAPCQGACKNAINTYPVQIRTIEREIVERGFAEGWIRPQPAEEKTGKRVAVVGAGPAGLTAAQQLARAGHDVTVFEKDANPGGLLCYGVPDFRLDKGLIDRRIDQMRAEDVFFKTGTAVGKDVSAAEITREFDAVCLAAGTTRPRDLEVPGRSTPGIHFALDYLRQANRRDAGQSAAEPEAITAEGKDVVVIGGGDTGNDCVETALAQGAASVVQLEILPQDEVTTDPTHRAPPEAQRLWSVTTKQFHGKGQLTEITVAQVQWVQSGNGQQMWEIPDTDFAVKADLALVAVGFEPAIDRDLAGQFHLATEPDGRVKLDSCATIAAGVFAAGDLVSGPALLVDAIHSGRKTAQEIHEYLIRQV